MHIIKVSPKGQITIPQAARTANNNAKQYLFELRGQIIMLRPIKIEPTDELSGFSSLAEKSLDFWTDGTDDIYQNFYQK